jgi:hypothetical protein
MVCSYMYCCVGVLDVRVGGTYETSCELGGVGVMVMGERRGEVFRSNCNISFE